MGDADTNNQIKILIAIPHGEPFIKPRLRYAQHTYSLRTFEEADLFVNEFRKCRRFLSGSIYKVDRVWHATIRASIAGTEIEKRLQAKGWY